MPWQLKALPVHLTACKKVAAGLSIKTKDIPACMSGILDKGTHMDSTLWQDRSVCSMRSAVTCKVSRVCAAGNCWRYALPLGSCSQCPESLYVAELCPRHPCKAI